MGTSDGGSKLSDYHGRRDFTRTREPSGEAPREAGEGRPVFVVQRHVARREHYDFRLEVDGVLTSWAVPKGPSTNPQDKRLAVRTEDHPLEYADFEGSIPAGEYGGGTVQLWDVGHYTNTTHKGDRDLSMAEGLEHGHVSVFLEGEKLSGGYALSRMGDAEERAWLLVKAKDAAADARSDPVSARTESVRSGRELEEIAAEEGRTLRGRDLEESGG